MRLCGGCVFFRATNSTYDRPNCHWGYCEFPLPSEINYCDTDVWAECDATNCPWWINRLAVEQQRQEQYRGTSFLTRYECGHCGTQFMVRECPGCLPPKFCPVCLRTIGQ